MPVLQPQPLHHAVPVQQRALGAPAPREAPGAVAEQHPVESRRQGSPDGDLAVNPVRRIDGERGKGAELGQGS